MRLSRSILAAGVAVALLASGAAASAAPVADEPDSIAPVSGEIVDTSGAPIGDLLAIELGPETLWMVSVSDLAPGLHGMQLHEVGDCGDGIAGVGGQVDGADLATLSVGPDGVAEATFSTSSDDLGGLDDLDGVSLVVHAQPDNRANIPARYQSTQSSSTGPDAITNDTGDVGAGVGGAPLEVESGFSRVEADRARTDFQRDAKAARDGRRAARDSTPRAVAPTSSKPTWSTPQGPGEVASASSPDLHRPASWSWS